MNYGKCESGGEMKTKALCLGFFLMVSRLVAGNSPEGAGLLWLGGDWQPSFTVLEQQAGGVNWFHNKRAEGDWYDAYLGGAISPCPGLGIYLSVGNDSGTAFQEGSNYQISSYEHFVTSSWSWNAQTRIYPAAWIAGRYVCGVSGNPDGWIDWPTIIVGYAYGAQTSLQIFQVSGLFSGSGSDYLYQHTQLLTYGLALPLANFLNIGGDFSTRLSDQRSAASPFPGSSASYYDNFEFTHLYLNTYWNLWPGAGANQQGTFIPGYGRFGQVGVKAEWVRTLDIPADQSPGSVTQTRGLTLGAPVSAYCGVSIALQDIEVVQVPIGSVVQRNDQSYLYSLSVTIALGQPDRRELRD